MQNHTQLSFLKHIIWNFVLFVQLYIFFFIIIYFAVLRFEEGLTLGRQALYHLSHTPPPSPFYFFALFIFHVWSPTFSQGQPHLVILLLMPPT
jgi:hypothetical protein